MAHSFLRTPFEKFLAYVLLIFIALVMVFPFVYMFTSAIKPHDEIVQIPPTLFPNGAWRWSNFTELFTALQNVRIGSQLFNSALVTVVVAAGWVLTSVLAGYAFARIPFPGAGLVFSAYLGTLMVPFAVLMVPLYFLMSWLGWLKDYAGNMAALTVPWLFTAYGTFLLRQAFMSLPRELEEAALIDGTNRWGALFKVYVPLVGPAIATLATIAFLYAWNSFQWPLVVVNKPENGVITLGLAQINLLYGGTRLDLVMAASVMAVLPTLITYLLAQRYFIEGVATSGMGGR